MIMGSCFVRVIPGELNYKNMISRRGKLGLRLSPAIEESLRQEGSKSRRETAVRPGQKADQQDSFKERNTDGDTQSILSEIWAKVLGLDDIDVFDSFSSMGGDSLMAIQLLKDVNKVFGDVLDISDVFSYPSIEQMSSYIDGKTGKSTKSQREKKHDATVTEDGLKDLLNSLESGETTTEDALKALGGL